MRGHVAAEVAGALSAAPDLLAIVAPAFPATGRTTIDGCVFVDGQVVAGLPCVADVFAPAGFAMRHVDRASIRGNARSAPLSVEGDRRPAVLLCDAETDADLAAIVRAGRRAGRPVLWVGSGGLARALAAELGERHLRDPRERPIVRDPVLVVVGSMTGVARAQATALISAGLAHVSWSLGGDSGQSIRAVNAALGRGAHVLVTLEGRAGDGEGDPQLVEMIGHALAPLAPRVGALLLTGGDTAVGVLRAWGSTGLDLVEELEPGVVLSRSVGARALPVVTKSGSFGDPETLARALAVLNGLRP